MFDYLQKFNNLLPDLRNKISSPSIMALILDLENKYKVDLAMTIMKVMIKSIPVKELPVYFMSDCGLARGMAENLSRELKEKVFFVVADYLDLTAELQAVNFDKDLKQLIKETSLILPSENLVLRFKNIIGTYVRGVRNKIDTRNSLAKDVKIGGLNLSATEIERVLRICDAEKFSATPIAKSSGLENSPVISGSPGLLVVANQTANSSEYNLKSAILNGQIKSVNDRLGIRKEISGPDKQLDLPVPIANIKPIISPVSSKIPLSVKPVITTPELNILPAREELKSIISEKSAQLPPLKPVIKPAISTKKGTVVRLAEKSTFWSKFSFGKNKKNKVIPSLNKTVLKPSIKPVASSPVVSVAAPVIVKIVTPRPDNISPASLRPVTTTSSVRPQMHDVKLVPRVMGPVEELQFLDLVNFRRLGKTPAEITTKILVKVKLLEKDGYDKMVMGVKVWRQSPVYRLYLRLGQEALVKGSTLKEVIEIRQKSGQDYLSPEEIMAIVNLNSKLVF